MQPCGHVPNFLRLLLVIADHIDTVPQTRLDLIAASGQLSQIAVSGTAGTASILSLVVAIARFLYFRVVVSLPADTVAPTVTTGSGFLQHCNSEVNTLPPAISSWLVGLFALPCELVGG